MIKTKFLCLLLLSLSVLPVAAVGQCIGDDGLYTGKCYEPVHAKLPRIPALKSRSLFVPYRNCKVDQVTRTTLVLPAPRMISCGIYYWTGVDYRTATGMPLWDPSALWLLFYTRTWMETDTSSPVGDRYQVWRFLVNAEVRPSKDVLKQYPKPTPNTSHLIPPCTYNHRAGQPVHYQGYVDYALNCRTDQWTFSFGVTHMCDVFTHNLFSKYPLGGHADLSYVAVAPDTFLPDTTLPGIAGLIRSEAFRMIRWPMLPFCESEQDVRQGVISRLKRKCACGQNTDPRAQFINYELKATSACKSSAASISPFPVLWGGSVQMSAGTFTGPGFPGKENLYFLVDPMFYRDGKTQALRADLFVGVGTEGGWRPNLFRPVPGVSQPRSFVDLQNVLLLPTFTHFSGMAGLFASDILLYFNTY
jgi:hypothetical protein